MDALMIPPQDGAEFSKLPVEIREEVRAWIRGINDILRSGRRGRTMAIKSLGRAMGVSYGAARTLFYLAVNGGKKGHKDNPRYFDPRDWRSLVNYAKCPDSDNGVPQEIVDEFMRRADGNQRKSYPAWRKMMYEEYPTGKLDHLPWPDLGDNRLPVGCTYPNLMRLAGNQARRTMELAAMRQGLGEAIRDYGSQILQTRVGLWVGSHFMPDDLKRDFKVVLLGERGGQSCCIQELGVLDVFSGDRFMIQRRPQFIREDGKKDSIKETEMRFLTAALFRTVGYSKRGTEIPHESGTAVIRKELAAFLHEHSGEKITCRAPGDMGTLQAIAGYYGRGGGNPRHKAPLESHHNLVHNDTGDILAATGHDRKQPEWLYGIEQMTEQVLKWMRELPPERAALLELPELEYWQALKLLAERDLVIAKLHDHDLEGWESCGHTTIEYKTSLIGDDWISQEQLLAMSHRDRQMIIQAAESMPALRRPRRLSRREVFAKGAQELCRFDDHVVAMMFCDRTLGGDLRITKSLTRNNTFSLENADVEPDAMIFEGFVLRPDGGQTTLRERDKHGIVLNPFDRDWLWVYDQRGGYVGTAPRRGRISRLDDEARQRALGQRAHEISSVVAPLAERHADRARQIADMHDHNQRVRDGKALTREEKDRARALRDIPATAVEELAESLPQSTDADADFSAEGLL